MFVGYAHDHTGDVQRFTHIETGQIIYMRLIMWKVYMQRERRMNQNMEDSESDSDSEGEYDEFHDTNKANNMIRDEEEDQAQDSNQLLKNNRSLVYCTLLSVSW